MTGTGRASPLEQAIAPMAMDAASVRITGRDIFAMNLRFDRISRRQYILAALGSSILLVYAFDAWLGTCGFHGCPTPAEIRAFHADEGGRVLDRSGHFMGHLAIVRRVNVPLADVPVPVRQAFIATEDRRFYQHNGIDWRGLLRASLRNIRSMHVREGFSTITMQVVRNTFAVRRYQGRSLRQKLLEMRLSRLLEQNLTKDQILELYLNVIYLGNGVYGVEAASRDLFGKHVSQLTIPEGAMLAALPKGPSTYTPRRNLRRARTRRNLVIGLMAREGYASLLIKSLAIAALRCASRTMNGAPTRATIRTRSTRCGRWWTRYSRVDRSTSTTSRSIPPSTRRRRGAADRAVRHQAARSSSKESYGRGEHIEGAMVCDLIRTRATSGRS